MEGGLRSDIIWQLMKGDGTLFWCRLIGTPLDPAAADNGSVWMLEDITDQKNAEQERLSLEVQLRHAQKLEAIGQLAAGIAHEINTPTQYIGDNTKFLAQAFQAVFTVMAAQADQLGPGALPEALARITEEADLPFLQEEIPKAIEQSLEGIARVTGIVQAMKDFSHPGGDQPEAMDLNQSIESTATVSRGEWKNVAELALDLDPEMPIVIGFPGEFNQVVLNLIVNAAHAIGERSRQNPDAKGLISISTRRDGDMAEVRIGDTGTGIPEWVQTRMFDLFFTTKAVGKGTGQGLSLVHNIVVKRHGGSIRFETRQGEGTVFLIRIPIQGPADHVNGRIQSAH
jgi:signal transduction histidine kinase